MCPARYLSCCPAQTAFNGHKGPAIVNSAQNRNIQSDLSYISVNYYSPITIAPENYWPRVHRWKPETDTFTSPEVRESRYFWITGEPSTATWDCTAEKIQA